MTEITTTSANKTGNTASESTEELAKRVERYQRELETVRNERDNALRAFGDSQKQLAATQVRAKIGTWERWIDSNRVYLSERSYRIIGYEPGDAEPSFDQLRHLIHPDDRDRVLQTFKDSEKFNRGAVIVFRVCRQDGETRSVRCEYVMSEDPSGRLWRMMGVIQDVTDLSDHVKNPGNELNPGNESDIFAAAEFCPFILVYVDVEGTIKFANRAMLEEIPSMELGQSIFYYTTYQTEEVRAVMKRVSETQRPIQFDFDNVSQAGEQRIFDAWIGPVIHDNEVTGFIFSILGPFTPDHRKSKKTGAPDSAPVLDAGLLTHARRIAKIGYWAYNYDAKVSIWSPEKFRILGLPEDSSISGTDTILELVVPEDHTILLNAETAAEDNDSGFEVEYRIVRPDGETRNILSCGEIVYNHLGEKTMVGTIQDITNQKTYPVSLRNAELKYRALFDEMRQSHEDMSRMTRKLSTIQEEERRRISLELHDSVGGLLSGLQIMMHLETGSSANLEELCVRVSETVDDIIDRVDRLTRQLRPSSLDQFGLKSTLYSHFKEFERIYNISLDVKIKIHNELVINEDVQIAAFRIIQEALNNIARHAGVESGIVRVSQKKRGLRILISDEGTGISEKILTMEDCGIGLDGMKERAMLLGGTLNVESSPGNGTTIRIRLPIQE